MTRSTYRFVALALASVYLLWPTLSLNADTLSIGGNSVSTLSFSLDGYNNGNVSSTPAGEVAPASFTIGAGPASKMILYSVDLPSESSGSQTFGSMQYNPSASAANTWNHAGIIRSSAPLSNSGGGGGGGSSHQVASLMKTFAPAINQHLTDNSTVGNVNGVNLAGTASDASLALNAAIWKQIYGNDFVLAGLPLNNSNVIGDYNLLSQYVGNADASSVYWFNLPGDRQGYVGTVSETPAPDSLTMCVAFGACCFISRYLFRASQVNNRS